MFELLTHLTWTDKLGWLLIHSLWQFAAVALFAFGLQWLLRHTSASVRYRILLAAMGVMVSMPIATYFFIDFDDSPVVASKLQPIEQPDSPPLVQPVLVMPQPQQESVMAEPGTTENSISRPVLELQPEKEPLSLQKHISPWLPTIVLIWLAGVILAALRPLLSWYIVHRLRTIGVLPVEETMRTTLERTAKRLGLTRTVEVLQSTLVKTPVVVGYFRPVILLPLSIVSGLSESQLELILAHELAHIRRHDYLINLLQILAETLFFYHPAMWWLSRQIRNERENCCDDMTMVTMGNRAEYGRALLAVEELRATTTTLSLAARGGSLVERIRRIAGCEPGPRLVSSGSILSVLLILIALFAAGTWAAAPTKDQSPMTAEAFSKLSAAEQRDTLVKAFQKRVELGRNLFCETEQAVQIFERQDGKPEAPDKERSCLHDFYRLWQLGDSCKWENQSYDGPKKVEPRSYSARVENAEEGIAINVSRSMEQDGNRQNGQVVPFHKKTSEELFFMPPSPDYVASCSSQGRFFQYLIESKDKFKIQTMVSENKVRLTVPWKNSKQVFLLDPKKDFLPICFDMKNETSDGEVVYETKFEVQESRLVDNVWMPVKMKKSIFVKERLANIIETNVLRVESDSVKPSDLLLPFIEGMKITDTIESITYTANAEGGATEVKDAPNWKHDPPKGWKKGTVDEAYSLASKISDADRKRLEASRQAKSKPIDEALAVLQADPPASQNQRIEAALKMFRVYRVGERANDWALALRELITIGKPAVPRLIEELDKTNDDKTLRALGFVLRGINDPRAIPALIRAIPRLIQPTSSDCGVVCKGNPKLQEFMRLHDHARRKALDSTCNVCGDFIYGRPIREIMPTLEKFTGQSLKWQRLNFSDSKADDINQLRAQRTLFLNHAKQWADWWSKNWQNFVDNEADAQLDLTEKSLEQFAQTIAKMPRPAIPTKIPCGPTVKLGDGHGYTAFEPYLNLDASSAVPRPRDLLEKSPKDKLSPKLLAWARREGIDLLRFEIKRPDDEKTYYAYQPVDMKVWKIDNKRLKNLEKELQESKELDLSLWKDPISSVDKMEGEMKEGQLASFLFITKQGACGTIQIRSGAHKNMKTGQMLMGPLAFKYQYIYESKP